MTNSTFICKFKYHLTLLKRTWLNSLNYWKRHLKYFPNRNNLLLASFPLFSIVMSVQWLVYYFYWICMCVHSDWFKSVCVVILYCLYVRRELIRTPCLYNAWDSQREIKIDLSLVVGVKKKGEASARIDAFSSSRAREKLIKHHFPCYTNNITFIVTSNFNKL